MVNRPAGAGRSKRWEQEENQWYVDPPYCSEQLFAAIDFGDDLIWDPCCGRGTILDVAKERGHPTLGSDVVDRHARHTFRRGNFISQFSKHPTYKDRRLSIVMNPPYGGEKDMAERMIRKALDFPVHRVAALLPIAFLCAEGRWRFFAQDFHPSHVLYLCDRPSMPPGSMIEAMGESAFKGGMADYIWMVWTAPHRWQTRSIWLKPDKILSEPE